MSRREMGELMPYKNREEHNAWHQASKRKNREEAIRLLGGQCALPDCDSTENLQFDHIRREDKVDHRIWSWSKERRLAELAKCQLLCEYHHVEKSMAENRGEIPRWAHYR